jgi:ornithine lipid ester-linked acyl 2-hydroxylase
MHMVAGDPLGKPHDSPERIARGTRTPRRRAANCASCPHTAALLETIPGVVTAFFSILSPHKHIPPHRGPYRGVVRCHLGLMVPGPPDACGISVGGEVRH